jgi:hypothetical protein
MRNRWLLLFAVAVVVLFFVANRAAYRGYFSDDDLDNIANARSVSISYYGPAMIKPMIARDAVFRPVPDLYYWIMSRAAELNFTPYVIVTQAIHLVNVWLVFLLARRMGAEPIGACAAAALFAFHASMMTIYWRPMYVFDLVCATFALLTFLAYVEGPVVLSIALFWLALKSKEVVVFLPVALLAYEWFLGKRRWMRVAPFFAVSALFGLWALAYNSGRNNDYSLRFTPEAFWTCVQFYASKLVLGPAWFGIAAIIVLAAFSINRRVRVGLLTFLALMIVLLVLPGRLYPAYLYTASIGLAIAISAFTRPAVLALFFLAWIPWNYRQLKIDRGPELAAARDRRTWVLPVAAFVRAHPDVDTFMTVNRPDSLADYGASGTIRTLRPNQAIAVVDVDSPDRAAALARPNLAVLNWNPAAHSMHVFAKGPDASYVSFSDDVPVWQLGEGWIDPGINFRWIGPRATARLGCPAKTEAFEVKLFTPDVYLNVIRDGKLEIRIDNKTIGAVALNNTEVATYRFPSSCGALVEFDVAPALKDPGGSPKLYGSPIMAFGFK